MATSMKVAAILVPAASAMTCPGSPAFLHASAQVTATVPSTSCKDVYDEITARSSGNHQFVDPHNGGIYKLTDSSTLSDTVVQIQTERTANPKVAVGGKAYVDKQTFTLTEENGDCKIEACSESQSFSIGDFSTNYCDIRNLYCGKAEGCNVVLHDLPVSESNVKTSIGAGKDKSKCIVTPSDAGVKGVSAFLSTSSMKCPGSAAFGPHASAQVTAVAHAASCSDVAEEITARAKGEKSWVDPHNHGVYTLLTGSDTEIQTQRTTNPKTAVGHKVYTDKQIFTLTQGKDGCMIEACSESQGTSVKDFSTNYCDIRNLYCGTSDGCTSVVHDLTVSESNVKPSFGAGKDKSQCIVKQVIEV